MTAQAASTNQSGNVRDLLYLRLAAVFVSESGLSFSENQERPFTGFPLASRPISAVEMSFW